MAEKQKISSIEGLPEQLSIIDVSIVSIDAYNAIQDISIGTQDSSILININEIAQLDSSIARLDAYNLIQDASILIPPVFLESSDVSITNIADNDLFKYDASALVVINEAPLEALDYFYTKSYIDGSLVTIENRLDILDVSASPGGVATNIQYNADGSFGGDPDLVWNDSLRRMGIGTNLPDELLHVKLGDVKVEDGSLFVLGNVGIGTSNPAHTLDVSGNIQTDGSLYFEDSTTSIYRNGNDLIFIDVSVGSKTLSELSAQDPSILININEIAQLDASVIRLDAYNAIQDISIAIVIGVGATDYDKTQDSSIVQLDASVIRLDAYDAIQDTSIAALPAFYRDRIYFNSDLDTVSPPILMIGTLGSLAMYPESKIDDDLTAIDVRLDSTDTWTDVTGADLTTTINNLIAWVDGSVSASVQWEYRAIVTYDGSSAETSIIVDYTL